MADSSKVTVTAQAVAPKRADAALEQIVGRLSLEPYISAANWQVDHVIHQTEGVFGATPWPLNAGMRKDLSQC
jgi:hypothetical protein